MPGKKSGTAWENNGKLKYVGMKRKVTSINLLNEILITEIRNCSNKFNDVDIFHKRFYVQELNPSNIFLACHELAESDFGCSLALNFAEINLSFSS
jgi:hypothetical protein